MPLKNFLKKENNTEDIPKNTDFQTKESKKDTTKRMLAEIEKLNAQLNAEKEIRTALNDKLIHLSEEIGDLRRAIIEKEKKISEIDVKATKSADLVKEVQPEKLFSQVKKEEAKIEALKVTIDANKSMMKKIIDDLKEIRSKMKIYRGSEEILKLYSDIKQDLATLNKLKSRIESDADRVESLFIEIQKKIKDQKSLSDEIDDIKKILRDNTKKLNNLELQLNSKASKQDIRKLINTIGQKPTILDKLLNKDKNTEKYINTSELIKAFKEDEEVSKKVESIENSMEEYKRIMNEAKTKVDASYKEIKTIINSNEEEKEKTKKLINDINKRIEELFQNENQNKNSITEIKKTINDILETQKKQKYELQQEINEIKSKVLDKPHEKTDKLKFEGHPNRHSNIPKPELKKTISLNTKISTKTEKINKKKIINTSVNIIIYLLVLLMAYNLIHKILILYN